AFINNIETLLATSNVLPIYIYAVICNVDFPVEPFYSLRSAVPYGKTYCRIPRPVACIAKLKVLLLPIERHKL
ncbi:MAG: hypothetical protein KGI37_11040, partial [Alphaproteobacteria bacterium]|nr:hypothetical protein [Alphaproteobacteria bacterium]